MDCTKLHRCFHVDHCIKVLQKYFVRLFDLFDAKEQHCKELTSHVHLEFYEGCLIFRLEENRQTASIPLSTSSDALVIYHSKFKYLNDMQF